MLAPLISLVLLAQPAAAQTDAEAAKKKLAEVRKSRSINYKEKTKAIAQLQKEIEAKKREADSLANSDFFYLGDVGLKDIGQIGAVELSGRVGQIVDDTNAILIGNPPRILAPAGTGAVAAIEAGSAEDIAARARIAQERLEMERQEKAIVFDALWLDGVSTSGWTDGQQVTIRGAFEVMEPKRYQGASGAVRTVPQLRKFDITPVLQGYAAYLRQNGLIKDEP